MYFEHNTVNVDSYWRFHVDSYNVDEGPRIGGAPPRGIFPKMKTENTRYFLTMPISKYEEISIFYSFDYSSGSSQNPFVSRRTIFDQSSMQVELCRHAISSRENAFVVPSDITGRKLTFSNSIEFESKADSSEPYPFHKIGGYPYFVNSKGAVDNNTVNNLLKTYSHWLQIGLPISPDDSILDVNWPFGEYMFHVFLPNKVSDPFQYIYVWG